jgi:monofunctional glycosyltransferase
MPAQNTLSMRIFKWFRWALYVALGLFLLYQASVLARVWWWVDRNPGETKVMALERERLSAKNPAFALKQQWTGYARISNHLKRAVIAAEDSGFNEHEGFDWDSIEKAWEKNRKKGKVVAGASTITQQVAKNLLLSNQRSYWRKGQEALITAEIEWLMEKDRILELYLNIAEWGEGVFGAEAAARHYFNVSAAQLSESQAAKLAAMLPQPRFYDKNRNAPYLLGRAATIQVRMRGVEVP